MSSSRVFPPHALGGPPSARHPTTPASPPRARRSRRWSPAEVVNWSFVLKHLLDTNSKLRRQLDAALEVAAAGGDAPAPPPKQSNFRKPAAAKPKPLQPAKRSPPPKRQLGGWLGGGAGSAKKPPPPAAAAENDDDGDADRSTSSRSAEISTAKLAKVRSL